MHRKLISVTERHRLLILIIVCVGSILIYGWFMKKEFRENIHRIITQNIPFINNIPTINNNNEFIINNRGFIIDSPGCSIPKLDPWDPSVANLIHHQKPYDCRGNPLYLMTATNGSIVPNPIVLNSLHLKASDIVCSYQAIQRKHEKTGSNRETNYQVKHSKPLHFGVTLNEDYVKVECKIGFLRKFEHYFPLVRLKDSVERVKSSISPPIPELNVILVGIDSVSKLNFLRHLRKTHAFVHEKLSAFDMKGYTKVGENTFPNLIPMLTGHFYDYYWNESVRNTMFWDDVDLVWKEYAAKGYRTFYAEDMPIFGTFQYSKRGFYDPPTDYYFRPMALAIHFSKLKKKSKEFCLNSQMDIEIIYNYLRDFVRSMESRPFFAFAMVSTVTHDHLNHAGYVDQPTAHLLEDLFHSGVLNKTVLIFFSDHGLRFGEIRKTYIGKFEERMPFMYIHFPKWFLEQYPQISKNLYANQKRLITLFDVHETLINLLDIRPEVPPTNVTSTTLGSSIMEEISENRTCSEANIQPHWCPCQTYESVPLMEFVSIKSAQEIVNNINSQLEPYIDICAVLEVETLLDAQLARPNDLVLGLVKQKRSDRTLALGDKINFLYRYLITLTVTPGDGMFEGTVQYNVEENSYKVLGVSRINMYGNHSECIDVHKLKIFCYCIS